MSRKKSILENAEVEEGRTASIGKALFHEGGWLKATPKPPKNDLKHIFREGFVSQGGVAKSYP